MTTHTWTNCGDCGKKEDIRLGMEGTSKCLYMQGNGRCWHTHGQHGEKQIVYLCKEFKIKKGKMTTENIKLKNV